jgi:hypothetical protein
VSVKDELHVLIDRLDDTQVNALLSYVQQLAAGTTAHVIATSRTRQGDRTMTVAGKAFFSQPPTDLETIARQHGVDPIEDIRSLERDAWPEDESFDDFVATIREWRREASSG